MLEGSAGEDHWSWRPGGSGGSCGIRGAQGMSMWRLKARTVDLGLHAAGLVRADPFTAGAQER